MVKKGSESGSYLKIAVSIVLIVVGLLVLVFGLDSRLNPNSTIDLFEKFVLIAGSLLIISAIIAKLNGLRKIFGMYLLGGQHGIELVDRLSKFSPISWKFMADWGLVVSFGLLAFLYFRKQVGYKALILGLASTLAIIFVLLYNSSLAFSFINLPQINGQFGSAPHAIALPDPHSLSITQMAIALVALVGGFASFMVLALLNSGLSILYGLSVFVLSLPSHNPNYGVITSQVPGVVLILPGISMPLFSGILAFALLLVVHEFSHGILARIAKVNVREIGLIMFGSVPMGAYVEPDEKQVNKLDEIKKTRILIAGIASNFLLAMVTFALLILLIVYVLPGFTSSKVMIASTAPNSVAANALLAGSQLLQWNGHKIGNLTDLYTAAANTLPMSTVNLVTDKGSYSLLTNATGKIGVRLQMLTGPTGSLPSSVIYFIYIVLSLSFLLNFFVGAANLLPLPALDGWQIYTMKIKRKRLLNFLVAITLLSILLNVLPWFYSSILR